MYRMRCKMICHNVTEPQGSNDPRMCGVSFGAVWSPDSGKPEDENAVFGKFTPSGHVNLTIVEEVAKNLKVGQAYYVDFSEAPQ
ncbi:hypothetical protein UFRH6_85 [Pseudomonas phage UF_RH6]|nr:hypothetical protein UFRH6_85 [Pseudomonas phage UF_RH6]